MKTCDYNKNGKRCDKRAVYQIRGRFLLFGTNYRCEEHADKKLLPFSEICSVRPVNYDCANAEDAE